MSSTIISMIFKLYNTYLLLFIVMYYSCYSFSFVLIIHSVVFLVSAVTIIYLFIIIGFNRINFFIFYFIIYIYICVCVCLPLNHY